MKDKTRTESITFRTSYELKTKLEEIAAFNYRSLSNMIETLLDKAVTEVNFVLSNVPVSGNVGLPDSNESPEVALPPGTKICKYCGNGVLIECEENCSKNPNRRQ